MIEWKNYKLIIGSCFLGAMAGVLAALNSTDQQFMSVFRYLLVLLLFFILIKPARWLNPKEFTSRIPIWLQVIIMFVLGFYGGYIQMGMGLFLLAFLVLGLKLNLMRANALKILLVGVYTLFVFLMFWSEGWIVWHFGLTIAIGQIIGGWMTAHYFSKWSGADKFAYYTLIAVVLFALVRSFLI